MPPILYYLTGSWIFIITLSMGEFIFSVSYARRDRFALRYFLSRAGALAFSCLPTLAYYAVDEALNDVVITNCVVIVVYLVMFGTVLLSMMYSYREPFLRCLVSGSLGFLCQNIYYGFFFILESATGLNVALYSSMPFPSAFGLTIVLQLVSAAVVLAACYFLFAGRTMRYSVEAMSRSSSVAIAVAALLFVLVFNALGNIFNTDSTVINIFVRALLMICCLGLLTLYVILIKDQFVERESAVVSKLDEEVRRHYAQMKETMELIDVKCHDIKHYIAVAGEEKGVALDELKELVTIYDTSVKTGNEVIDTLLAERVLYCNAHDIRLTVIADASRLDFISTGDMCSLFGNMIENAVEAVDRVREREKRLISVNIRPVAGQVFMSVENCFAGEVKAVDGLPVTDKENVEYHGYGLKSIRMVAEKYDGVFSYKAENGLFRVSVLFPVPEPR